MEQTSEIQGGSIGTNAKNSADRLPCFLALQTISQLKILDDLKKQNTTVELRRYVEAELQMNLLRIDFLQRSTTSPTSIRNLRYARELAVGFFSKRNPEVIWTREDGMVNLSKYEPILPSHYEIAKELDSVLKIK